MSSKTSCVLVVLTMLLIACQTRQPAGQVVVYTSVDQPIAEPILDKFERTTGIDVLPVYDVEATKTTGLVNRLIAEKSAPKADVFWNNEIIQTMALKDQGVLTPYVSPEAATVPAQYRDPSGYWTGYAARARVLIANRDRIASSNGVDSIEDLLDVKWPGDQIGIANPLFGTTATHAAALYEAWGRDKAYGYFKQLADRGVRVVDGNSVVRDLVVSGQLAFGLTDTDDACGALMRGDPVVVILPDQDSFGTLVIPGTVALIANAPHLDQGKVLVDFLLKAEVEQALVDAQFSHVPVHSGINVSKACISVASLRRMEVDYQQVYQHLAAVQTELRDVFVR